jgi:NADH-quinone oxidoreductase subunit K
MNEAALLQNYLILGAMLFGIGMVGFLVRRNLIVIFLCAEMMLQGISLSLVAWGRYHDNWDGQSLVVFIITVAACEAGIALVLVLMLCQRSGNLDIVSWQTNREEGLPPFVDQEVPEELADDPEQWPTLSPAGVKPEHDPDEHMYRTNV